jgi:hypothetical protein
VDYRARYATSTSPTGPLTIPANNLVIAKDTLKGIYATGHNSVIQIPNKDEWYIIYHRFTRPKGITMGAAAGYNREVCIDTLKFNTDGSIIQVKPTLEGISPVVAPPTTIKKKKRTTSLMLFPNPAKDMLNVRYALNGDAGGTISVYNLLGQKLMQYPTTNDLTQIDISGLTSNMYLLSYSIYNQVVGTNKFIKQSQTN